MANNKEMTLEQVSQLQNKYQALHKERMDEHEIML